MPESIGTSVKEVKSMDSELVFWGTYILVLAAGLGVMGVG
jgi:hypothetical protein